MDIKFKIICVDDSGDYVTELKDKIKRTLTACNYVLEFVPYDDYDLFYSEKITNKGPECFEEFDLILVDFNLTDTVKKTGTNIVKDIRAKNVLTTIIFYSQNIDAMKKSYGSTNLEDVILEERGLLNNRIGLIAKKMLLRDLSIISLRGLVLDKTSYFDYVVFKAVRYFEQKLTANDKAKIKMLINQNSFISINPAFKTKYEKDADYFYKLFNEKGHLTNFSIKNKYHVFSEIIKYFNNKTLNNFCFTDYLQNIQKLRDDFAHKKLTYSSDRKKVLFHNSDGTTNSRDKNTLEGVRKEIIKFNTYFEYVEDGINKNIFLHI